MDERKLFEMTEEQEATILDACKPVPYIVAGGTEPVSPQTHANNAWCALGREMGFDGMTVRPVPGEGQRTFTAVAIEEIAR